MSEISQGVQLPQKPLWFFTVPEAEQKPALLKALTHVKPFIGEFKNMMKISEGGEKSQALAFCQQELMSAEAILMNRNDAVVRCEMRVESSSAETAQAKQKRLDTAIDEHAIAFAKVVDLRAKAVVAMREAQREESALSFEIVEHVIENALNIHYENAVSIVAIFANISREALSKEKDIFEIAEMLFQIASDDKVISFFTRWHQFKSKLRFVTSRK